MTELDDILARRDAWVAKIMDNVCRVKAMPRAVSEHYNTESNAWTLSRDQELVYCVENNLDLSAFAQRINKSVFAVRQRATNLDLMHKKDNSKLDNAILSYRHKNLSTYQVAELLGEEKHHVTMRVRYMKIMGIIGEDEFHSIRNRG